MIAVNNFEFSIIMKIIKVMFLNYVWSYVLL